MTMAERLAWLRSKALADLEAMRAEPEPQQPARAEHGPNTYVSVWQQYCHAREDWRLTQELVAGSVAPLRVRDWLGRPPTHSETTLFSRAYAEGEARGLWRVLRTDAGRAWALELTGVGDAV